MRVLLAVELLKIIEGNWTSKELNGKGFGRERNWP
jgi:hypothetical protein